MKQKLIIVSNFEGKGDRGRIKYKSVPFCTDNMPTWLSGILPQNTKQQKFILLDF